MAKVLTPADLYDRIHTLFIDFYNIQENTVKEIKELGISEEKARILVNSAILQQIDNYLDGLNMGARMERDEDQH